MTDFPIDELNQALGLASDFAFEMRVLNIHARLAMQSLEHGGTYIDYVTKKPRQFDIRAVITAGGMNARRVALAVECKNIGDRSAILVHCSPRRKAEACHSLLSVESTVPKATIDRLNSPYRIGLPVGKSIDHVVHKKSEIHFQGDGDVYTRYAQAISSAQEFVANFASASHRGPALMFVLPVLVVPDGKLFVQKYTHEGERDGETAAVPAVDYFVDAQLSAPLGRGRVGTVDYRVSHIRIVEESELLGLLRSMRDQSESMNFFVAKDAILYGDLR